MGKRYTLILVLSAVLGAQETVAPTPERVGESRGEDVNTYNVTQSFETGYRWMTTGGDLGMYRSMVNFGNGIRLLGSSLTVKSREGQGRYFDEILLNTQGLGNDPYQNALLRIQKNRLYKYEMNWRLNSYYNPGLTVAAGNHFRNTARRMQDHDLTLLPQSRIRFRVGYSRNTEDGPALTTSQEFDANGYGLPVFYDVRRTWNEYRLGFDVDYRGFVFSMTRRWDYFKEDSGYRLDTIASAPNPADQTSVQQFVRGEPAHGANPGWLGNLSTRRRYWGLNARMTYVDGHRDFITNEIASGTGQLGGPASRVILVSGNARRPVLFGDASISVYPSDRLTIVNNTAVVNNRIDGDSRYTEFITGADLGTTVNFQALGIRTVSNATDVNYRVRKWIGFYASYRFSDRRIRTVEGSGADTISDRSVYEVNNTLHSGLAGVRLRPWKALSFNLEGEVGRADAPLTAIADRNYHGINGRIEYRTKKWQLSTAYRQNYNLNPSLTLGTNSSRSRNYSANASWAPRDGFWFDASYMKLHLDTQTGLLFFASTTTRPQLQNGFFSFYESNIHSGTLGMHFTIARRADLYTGYTVTKDTGGDRRVGIDPVGAFLASVQTFPLAYHSPLARLSIRISSRVRWNAGWQYYGYHQDVNVFGFEQNFRANTGYTSLLWTF